MIDHPAFTVEPWALRETELHTGLLAQTESVFALSNGHIGVRANLDEGEPHSLPGTYLNSVYELRPLPYAEAGFGYPESGQTVINVTNGKLIRLLVDDEPFDVTYGDLETHERLLDFRAGTLSRLVRWTSPAGRRVVVRSSRLVSFTHRSIMAIAYDVEAVDDPVRLVIQSELVTNEQLPPQGDDPRVAAVLESPLVPQEHLAQGSRVSLVHQTRHSELLVSTSMDHVVEAGPDSDVEVSSESAPDFGRVTVTARLKPGQRLRVVKFVSYGWSSERSLPALRDQVRAGLVDAIRTGWDGLLATARVPRRLLGRGGRRARGRPGAAAGGALRAVPRAAVRGPGRTPPDPGQGAHRTRVRRARVLGHRDLRAARAHVHGAEGCRRRAPLAALDAGPGEGAGRAARPGGAPRSRGGPSTGRSAPGTGPPGRPPSTSTPTSPPRCCATRRRPATTRSPATSASNSSSRRPGCGTRSDTTTSTGASGSTG
jgi:hypothetical protein